METKCPSCGYCPTCGRGPSFIHYVYPQPTFIPYQPWPYQPWWQSPTTGGFTTTTGYSLTSGGSAANIG